MRDAKSFCRTCIAQCGVVLTVDDEERIAAIRADREHPVSAGYACFKGLQAHGSHYGPARLLHSQKRMPDGYFETIPVEQAFDEIARKLTALRARDGAEAIGLFRGTGGFHNSTAFGIHGAFLEALGSPSLFTTLSIDQSAKAITACRMGRWHAGRDHIDQSDVALLFGSNPLVSHSAGGFLVSDPVKRLKQAAARGLKLIVVDPRRSEIARFAAIHLQPYPGEDVSIAAGFLRIILGEGWHDAAFCARHVAGLEALRRSVASFTPDRVAARAGISASSLHDAAELFARQSRRGGVITGTGPNMAPRSNLAEHLIQCIEVVCGRFKRAGDPMSNADPLSPQQDWFAEVVPPFAPWDAVPPSRIRGVGNLFGEKLTGTLAEEITTPGPGQIRALIVNGANIANSVPGKPDMVAALRALELLVVIDPHLTPTAELADYVIAPKLQFERADLPITLGMALHADAWAQFTPAIVSPPAGAEVVDDWYVFWSLARRMGLALRYAGTPIDMEHPPTTEDLLALGMKGTALSLDALIARPGHVALGPAGTSVVKPARAGADARFRLDPEGVLDELEQVADEPPPRRADTAYPFRLIARRMRDVNGSIGMQTPEIRRRNPYNPLHLNPNDIRRYGLTAGATVEIVSPDGRITAIAHADDTLREGVVSMSHNWGGLSNDPAAYPTQGASTNILIRPTRHFEALNAMPWMSAIPVNIRPLAEIDGSPGTSTNASTKA
jgi:anaerobic selenocysteine-containing dehydrogenase